jgi:hypothetical protein
VSEQFAAERGEHVGVADGGLLAVPRRGAPAGCEVGFGVAVKLVPADGDRLGEESERDRSLDGVLDAVAGFADAVRFRFLM